MNAMELIKNFNADSGDNPQVGDLGTNGKNELHRFTKDGWVLVGYDATSPISVLRQKLQEKKKEELKSMYQNGITNYWSKDEFPIRMTIRPDGTEYIDKRDMPA